MSRELRAQLQLSQISQHELKEFFVGKYGLLPDKLLEHIHLTVYFSEIVWPKVELGSFDVKITIPITEFRFMVMVPGGEIPREHIEPQKHKIGLRIRERGGDLYGIQNIRAKYCKLETNKLLNGRKRSTKYHSAFGAKKFRPHITVLLADNGIQRDLTPVGNDLRSTLEDLRFDRLVIRETTSYKKTPKPHKKKAVSRNKPRAVKSSGIKPKPKISLKTKGGAPNKVMVDQSILEEPFFTCPKCGEFVHKLRPKHHRCPVRVSSAGKRAGASAQNDDESQFSRVDFTSGRRY